MEKENTPPPPTKRTNVNTVMKTISLPLDLLPVWDALKRKSEMVQIVLAIAETYESPNDVEDDLRRMLFDRRKK